MSNEVYPVLPGRSWDTTLVPTFSTRVLTSVNLNEFRASFSASPVYQMKLSYDVLRDGAHNGVTYTEMRELLGFFMARRGKYDSFLYEHPEDSVVAAEAFGTGDGSTANFSLQRAIGDFSERVANVNVITQITVSNTPTSNYTVSATGVVTFNSPPAANAALAWSGSYYYRCRFANDAQEVNEFMSKLWNARSVELVGSLGTKI